MTELVRYEPPSDEEWAALARQSDVLAKSNLMPKALTGRPMAVFTIMLKGRELGLSPLVAISEIHVVDGKAGMSAQLMRGLVRQAGHRIWRGEASDESVTMHGKRSDDDTEDSATFTLADARRAGLDRKDNWTKYPKAMLTARATADLCRLLFSDVLLGCGYLPEELGSDAVDGPMQVASQVLAPEAVEHEHLDGTKHTHANGALDHDHEPKDAAKPDPDYDPAHDLERFTKDGIEDWTVYANADVRRRNPKQAAADRLMAALVAGDARVIDPRVRDVIEGQVVPTDPAAGGEASDSTPAVVAPAAVPEFTPCTECGCDHNDGWPGECNICGCGPCGKPDDEPGGMPEDDGQPLALVTDADEAQAMAPPTEAELAEARADTSATAESEADPASEVSMEPSTTETGEPVNVATGEVETSRDVERILGDIDAAAEILGRTREQLMVRWTLANKCNPEDGTPESLDAFLEGIMPEVQRALAAEGN